MDFLKQNFIILRKLRKIKRTISIIETDYYYLKFLKREAGALSNHHDNKLRYFDERLKQLKTEYNQIKFKWMKPLA